LELRLKDTTLPIRSAELSASVLESYGRQKQFPTGDPRFFWTLEVWAEGELEGGLEEMRATAEEMRFPVRRWTDVANRTVEWAWSGPYDEKSGAPYGGFYLAEHDRIGRARLRFAERDGVNFRFEWEGLCDVHLYGRDVPFAASGWARFTGVTVSGKWKDTEESLRERLAEQLDPRDFVQGPPIRRDDRIGLFRRHRSLHALFTPRAEGDAGS
jgi:hypothetical protein